ncbi:hypothetical protein QVN03_23705 [Raoultella terrigena]|jgi:hypothetical protein|uniref:hypothetical protein n=1 Tax=Raoultella terrigena TaxID=577 RepID=UPI000F48C154|nr:hypothetical protein [Raoultella terrigena]MCE9901580.1 hypothetical protein [Raoultella terrigena]MEB7601962.1 hypothetical protein [Raoultella terrigena]MEB8196381.1 hypothetical protein [Raoultella terrigena]ROS31843.1 hypothetical protein EDF79_0210 [Raoultella terrigena]WJV38344.1 hypothetical protein QVN03_23705 [Raoultella terrigena]
MKVLSLEEMNAVSGAYSWSSPWDIFSNIGEAVVSATLGAVAGFAGGAVIGGKHGGDGGGILGFGIIGQGVGMIVAGVIGGVTCGIGAAIVGYDDTWKYTQTLVDGFLDGTFKP